jgi:hypothetical protein
MQINILVNNFLILYTVLQITYINNLILQYQFQLNLLMCFVCES